MNLDPPMPVGPVQIVPPPPVACAEKVCATLSLIAPHAVILSPDDSAGEKKGRIVFMELGRLLPAYLRKALWLRSPPLRI